MHESSKCNIIKYVTPLFGGTVGVTLARLGCNSQSYIYMIIILEHWIRVAVFKWLPQLSPDLGLENLMMPH